MNDPDCHYTPDPAFPFTVFDRRGRYCGQRRTRADAAGLLRMLEKVSAGESPYVIREAAVLEKS